MKERNSMKEKNSMFVDENTSRSDLLEIIYEDRDLFTILVTYDMDPAKMSDDELRETIIDWFSN